MKIHNKILPFGAGYELKGPLIIELQSLVDKKGSFTELYREEMLNSYIESKFTAVRENISISHKNRL